MGPIKKTLLAITALAVGLVLCAAAFAAWATFYGRSVPPAAPGTVRIACVGDSITYGVFNQGYPGELDQLLGSAYSVRNFGAIGHTLQKDGDHPYWGHRYFRLSTELAPDIVLIMLGTNDSKTGNWKGNEAFVRDYQALIAHYQSLPSRPRILLMTPPSAFLVNGHSELPSHMSADAIATISGLVKQLGASLSLPVIDIHAATAGHPEFFPRDGVHPNADGNRFIATQVLAALRAQGGAQPQ